MQNILKSQLYFIQKNYTENVKLKCYSDLKFYLTAFKISESCNLEYCNGKQILLVTGTEYIIKII